MSAADEPEVSAVPRAFSRRPFSRRLVAASATVLCALGAGGLVVLAAPAEASAAAVATPAAAPLVDFGCAVPSTPGGVRCFGSMRPSASGGPVGLTPRQLRDAYGLTGRQAHGRTVAIVDAYDAPTVEQDLAHYRKQFGLPACTTANHCFRKVNMYGKTSPLPAPDYGWSEEITLDVEAVSAACPDCHILLLEATSPDSGPLVTAVNTAARMGAFAISNSYGGSEDSTIRRYDRFLRHPGVAVTASSGDSGYGVSWPASSPYVTAVGGTTLTPARNARGWVETAWSGSGSGCSKYEPKPAWQHDRGCSKRTVADVAAVADPASGLAVYGTYHNCLLGLVCNSPIGGIGGGGLDGWAQVGGTSLSAPVIAAVYAVAGKKVTFGSTPYGHSSALWDVRRGSNGSCRGSYLCTAAKGYDGPTGLGTPVGTGGF